MPRLGIRPNIHIPDYTNVPVNLQNENYENSSIVKIDGEIFPEYKLDVLKRIMDDSGNADIIIFGLLNTRELELVKDMLKPTSYLKADDILINGRRFLSH